VERRLDLEALEPEAGWGEAMRRLPNDRWRAYVCALFELPKHGQITHAIQVARSCSAIRRCVAWARSCCS
jgi:hypothetical protein